MTVVTFNNTELTDLVYEINDSELVNDVLCIVGEPGAEVLIRGYDAGSIAKYGRRSYRINNPIVANVAALYATPKAQVTAMLDRNIEPQATVQATIISKTEAIFIKLLGLEISHLVQITETTSGLDAVYFIVESLSLAVDAFGIIEANLQLTQARANEVPLS